MSSILSSIVVTLPWPVKQVWPNWRQSHHWRTYWKHVQRQRYDAQMLAREQIGRMSVPSDRPGKWLVHLDIYPPNLRRRDHDGMEGACKSAVDGIADALGVDDSRFAITSSIHEPRRPHGAVVATVTAPVNKTNES